MPLDWQELSGDVTVRDLMTPRTNLLCLSCEEQRQEVLEEAEDGHYDIVPVGKDGRIIAVLCRKDKREYPLDRSWLVSGDTTIPALVELFLSSEHPALLVLRGQKIGGLVTPADLNRIAARVFFYHLLAELEWRLAELVREHFDDEEEAMDSLSERKRQRVECLLARLKKRNFDTGVLEAMDLSDLVTIVGKCEALYDRLGYPSRRKFDDAVGPVINILRHPTMHPVRTLLTGDSGSIEKVHACVSSIRQILSILQKEVFSPDARKCC